VSLASRHYIAWSSALILGAGVALVEAGIMYLIHKESLGSILSKPEIAAIDATSIGLFLSLSCYLLIQHHAKSCSKALVDHGLSLAAMDSLGHGIVITNEKGKILFINREFESITGYNRKEVLGKTPSILQSGKQSTEFYASMWHDLQLFGQWRGTLWNKRKNGELYHERLNIRRYTASCGDTGYVGVFSDISELDQLQRALIDAQKRELMATLTGSLAHNFNNFLAVIQGTASMGEIDAESEKCRQGFTEILGISASASELVRDLLAISRQGTTDLSPFELVDLVRQTAHTCEAIIPANISFIADIPGDITGQILGNPSDIEQTILNLVSNARDALERRANARIALNLVASCKGESTCLQCPHSNQCPISASQIMRISVADNGPGIPAEMQQKIFAPFFTTKDAHRGTGLGLASAKHIADRHNGAIWLQSSRDNGSRFVLCLPLMEEKQRLM